MAFTTETNRCRCCEAQIASAPMALILLFAVICINGLTGCADESHSHQRHLTAGDVQLLKAEKVFRKSPARAIAIATTAAESGHIGSMVALGEYTISGKFHAWNSMDYAGISEADRMNEWFVRAREASARSKNGNDLWMAARLHRAGVGGPADEERAYELMMEAARAGREVVLYFEAMRALKKDDVVRANQVLRDAQSENFAIAYVIESYVGMMLRPSDIVGHVRPLTKGAATGDVQSKRLLDGLFYDLNVTAERGEVEAARSIELLKKEGLWKQPEVGVFPREPNAWL